MIRSVLFSTLLLSASGLNAQTPLTLTHENYTSMTIGKTATWRTVDGASVALPTEGESQIWNYSGIQATAGSYTMNPISPDNDAFPSADYAFDSYYGVGSFLITGNAYYEVNQSGVYEIGNKYNASTFDLMGMGTLTIPEQNFVYEQPKTLIEFPATYQSSWGSSTRIEVNTTLQAAIFGLPDPTPTQHVQHVMVADTVIGWGTLTLPGGVSFEALLVKNTFMAIDSFYVGGLPAPPTLLLTLGLTQADTLERVSYSFITEEADTPVMSISLDETGVTGAEYRSDLSTTSVGDRQSGDEPVRVYPNPVAGRAVTMEFDKSSAGVWTVTVYDAPGRAVLTHEVAQPAGPVRMHLPVDRSLPSGVYLYDIRNEHGVRTGGGTLMITR